MQSYQVDEERSVVQFMACTAQLFEQIHQEKAILNKNREDQLKGSGDAVLLSEGSDLLGNDPELEALAAHLNATAPEWLIDPAFRESLRSNLISMVKEHQKAKTSEVASNEA